MIKIGETYFACDECPICKGIDYRMNTAEYLNCDPQFEYCSCEKVGDPFYCGGFCEDAFIKPQQAIKNSRHIRGSEYRRRMAKKKKERRIRIIKEYGNGYNPNVGYMAYKRVNGVWQELPYIQYPKVTRTKFLKKLSSKAARKHFWPVKGNGYRRFFDYWWTLY